jgi:ATPases of the AAA+ class-like protein
MNKYSNDLLRYATKLDALRDGCGELPKYAYDIVERHSEEASFAILRYIEDITKSGDCSREVVQTASLLQDCLIRYYGYLHVVAICGRPPEPEDQRTLEELQSELNNLVGLKNVKAKVDDLIAYQKVQILRRAKNLHAEKATMHMAFTGKPGTGKTTVARIIGHIYRCLGLLSKGHFIEVSRTDLIAGYQGQTALKVKGVIERAKGGVLFIDEAYSITENEHSDSYGRECLTELTKALEDYRDDLVVIVAGYTTPMQSFFEANPGLRSRFNTFIEFDDYSVEELEEILATMCAHNDYMLSDGVKVKVHSFIEEQVCMKDKNFANGRMMRNLYDDLVMNHARRVMSQCDVNHIDVEKLSLIVEEDFQYR